MIVVSAFVFFYMERRSGIRSDVSAVSAKAQTQAQTGATAFTVPLGGTAR
jgi:hypothetical protein